MDPNATTESPLNAALRHFEASEANLSKAEKVLQEIEATIPVGIAFGDNPVYESHCRKFKTLLNSLPKIDGWRPEALPMELDEIAQNRFDAQEVGEIDCIVSVERQIGEPARQLRDYRYRFDEKRRELVRDTLSELISKVDVNVKALGGVFNRGIATSEAVKDPEFAELKENVAQMTTLLGSSMSKPSKWNDLLRHIRFGKVGDVRDIIQRDWPNIRIGLKESCCGDADPVPVDIEDIGVLVGTKPYGPVATKLRWDRLTDEEFERLLFALISSEQSYENPEWLMKTNAPDRGRDLSVYRVYSDPLGGTFRQRVVIQCKHWLSKSVGPSEIATLKEQMMMWESPRVDVHVIATSGRFTSDAVAIIETQNHSDRALKIEMWPESHLERLLASRPAIIAEFHLR